MTLGNKLRRLLGAGLAALCFIVWSQTDHPDMRISDSGRLSFWSDTQEDVLYVERKRSDRYGRAQFMQRAGVKEGDMQSYKDSLALCDSLGCRLEVKGAQISVLSHPSEVPLECESADIVILTQREAGPVARRACKAILLDARSFERYGAHDVFIREDGIELSTSNTAARRSRPWGQR